MNIRKIKSDLTKNLFSEWDRSLLDSVIGQFIAPMVIPKELANIALDFYKNESGIINKSALGINDIYFLRALEFMSIKLMTEPSQSLYSRYSISIDTLKEFESRIRNCIKLWSESTIPYDLDNARRDFVQLPALPTIDSIIQLRIVSDVIISLYVERQRRAKDFLQEITNKHTDIMYCVFSILPMFRSMATRWGVQDLSFPELQLRVRQVKSDFTPASLLEFQNRSGI
jgi:hypothetical protein